MLPVPPTSTNTTTAAVPDSSSCHTTSVNDAAVASTTNNDERNIDHDTFHCLIQDKGTALSEGDLVPNGWYYDIDGK